jgi:hypothetical protein
MERLGDTVDDDAEQEGEGAQAGYGGYECFIYHWLVIEAAYGYAG